MNTITDDLIEKFIEAGLINLKLIDQVRSLEMIREEFKKAERERIVGFAEQFIDVVNIEDKDIQIIYNETYGGGEQ
jgi:hypothetical protein